MRPAADFVRIEGESAAVRRRRRLAGFRQPWRLEIATLTLGWPEGEDLAESFPGLLFALATGYGTPAARQVARRMLDLGEPLKAIAGVLALPYWIRRIPATCFQHPLPPLPLDEEFAAIVLNRIPADPAECADWLDRLTVALRLVGRDFALWATREARFLPPAMPDTELQWLLAWAWACRNPRSAGHALVRSAWHPAMTWKRAHDEISIWRRRIDLVSALAGDKRDPWFQDGEALGFEFRHLDTVEDFVGESLLMENCLDQYATHLAYGRVRVFSVRRAGRPVADVELTLRTDEANIPQIAQVRGPRNRRAPPAVWQAVHAWLGAQPFRPLAAVPVLPTAGREALRAFWTPYVEALAAAGLADRFTGELIGRGRRRQALGARAGTMAETLREMLAATVHGRLRPRD